MIDFGIDKLALIGAVALIVIGPERLPRVARTVGALLGKAQRYVSQVQAEVNRSIELEELNKMKSEVQSATTAVGQSISDGLNEASSSFSSSELLHAVLQPRLCATAQELPAQARCHAPLVQATQWRQAPCAIGCCPRGPVPPHSTRLAPLSHCCID